jgi:hypothetical protein
MGEQDVVPKSWVLTLIQGVAGQVGENTPKSANIIELETQRVVHPFVRRLDACGDGEKGRRRYANVFAVSQ